MVRACDRCHAAIPRPTCIIGGPKPTNKSVSLFKPLWISTCPSFGNRSNDANFEVPDMIRILTLGDRAVMNRPGQVVTVAGTGKSAGKAAGTTIVVQNRYEAHRVLADLCQFG